jgi:uncharacterized membrane protein YqjE
VSEHEPGADAAAPVGLVASVRALLATLVAIGHNRLELLGVEIQEEVERVASLLLWSVAALLAAFMTGLLLSAAIVLFFDPPQRWLAAAGLGILFLAGTIWAASVARSRVAMKPRAFDAILSELAKDHDLLKG